MTGEYMHGKGIQMNLELARRIRSFLTEGLWWQIVQLARQDMGDEHLVSLVLVGIPSDELTENDHAFAQALNWSVLRKDIDLTNVATYEYPANWWYAERDVSEPLSVTGSVSVVLNEPREEAVFKELAEKFAKTMVRRGHAEVTDAIPDGDPKAAKRYTVSGKVVIDWM